MNRKIVLEHIIRYFNENKIDQSISELLIEGHGEEFKTRSIFVSGANDLEDLENIRLALASFFEENHWPYTIQISYHQEYRDLINNRLVPLSSNNIENNFRGRLIHRNAINLDDEEGLVRQTMLSFWRLFITQKDKDFFVRHDIAPTLWQPGYSIGGQPEYRSGIARVFEYLSKSKPKPILDLEFDRLRCFAIMGDRVRFQFLEPEIRPNEIVNQTQVTIKKVETIYQKYFNNY